MTDDAELLEALLVEGRDLVGRAAEDLAELARGPDAREALDGLFRSLHTLKGSTALFDLPVLTGLLHAAESRLEGLRDGGGLDDETAGDITGVLDVTETWFDVLEAGSEPGATLLQAAAALTVRLAGGAPGRDCLENAVPKSPVNIPTWAAALARAQAPGEAVVAVRYRPDAEAYFRGDDPLAVAHALPGLRALEVGLDGAPPPKAAYDPFHCRLLLHVLCAAPEAAVRAALRLVSDQVEVVRLDAGETAEPADLAEAAEEVEAGPLRAAAQTARVSTARLDDVAALIDELVIAKNALDHAAAQLAALAPPGAAARDLALRQATLDRLVSDLHGAVGDLRMVSLRGLFGRFPRHVREAAARLGKTVDFQTAGQDVALDKTVVDALFEPLLHLLRNALDHGVEAPDERRGAGKPEAARVRLAAYPAGEAVVIEVSDDGRGVDPAAVRDRAIERGLVDEATAGRLSEAEAAELIFAAGFSTARQVGEFSGRGVGMDSVRAALAGLGGRVDLDNRPGEGLTVRLTLPARTVLARVLVVEAGGERFGVPLEAVGETHRVRADEVTAIRAGRAYVRRDQVIPILRLRALLGLGEAPDPAVFPVLTVTAAGGALGVQVDALGERLEAPLRPTSGLLKGFRGLLGSMLQGDGRILLVLNLAEMAA
ncbi:chemotaxis protein CheA [Caulobacter sp. KR2-114]|uniref:chemotaxis protein CheA n=1 Tax=Caulobacter sp. KR2-114 TaxID=3400912 RepID=UPI003C117AD7